MHDSLDLEKIARRVPLHQQRQRRTQLVSLGGVLAITLLLLADVALVAPMTRLLQQILAQNPENVAAIMQNQLLDMMSFILEIGALVGLVLLLQWRTNRAKGRKEHVRMMLLNLLPDLENSPQAAPSGSPSWIAWVMIVVVVADIAIVLSNQPPVLTFVLPVLVAGAGWVWTASSKPDTEAEDTYPSKRLALIQQIIMVVIMTVTIAIGLVIVYPALVALGIRTLIALVLALFAGVGLSLGALYGLAILPYLTIHHGPLARGDYDTAIATWQRWGRLCPLLGTDALISFTLLLAGRPAEAKPMWWTLLVQSFALGHPLHAALRLVNFASALQTEEYDTELAELFAGAVRIAPENPVPYRSLAAYYLATDVYPERALALTDMTMRYAKPPGNNLLLQRYDWGVMLGVRALALASVGRYTEAETLITRAFAESDPQFQPGVAWLHWCAGRIKRQQQDRAAAATHFQQAIQLDPHGTTGAASRDALATLDDEDRDEYQDTTSD